MKNSTKRMFRERALEDERRDERIRKSLRDQMAKVADTIHDHYDNALQDLIHNLAEKTTDMQAAIAEENRRRQWARKMFPLQPDINYIQALIRCGSTRAVHIAPEMFTDPDSVMGQKLRAHIDGMKLGRWETARNEFYRKDEDIWSRKEYPYYLTILCASQSDTEDLMQALM